MDYSNVPVFEAPMSCGQQRLWFLQNLDPDTSAYHIPFALTITGPLSVSRFSDALGIIVAGHEPFRTRFAYTDSRYQQIIYAEAALNFDYMEYTADPERNLHDAMQFIMQDKQQAFRLEQEFPYRFYLFRLAEEQYLFYANIHHIMFDRASFPVFMAELLNYYHSPEAESVLDEQQDIQYADYCFWQQEQLEQGHLASQQNYWLNELQQSPVLQLPVQASGSKSGEKQRGKAECRLFQLPAEMYESLQKWCRSEGITLNMGLLSAYNVLLSMYTGQSDLIVGTPSAGRNRREVENTIGFFVNTLLIRSRLNMQQNFRTYVKQIKQKCLQAYENQDLPFDKLVEMMNPERDAGTASPFQTIFSLQNRLDTSWNMGEIQLEMMELHNEDAKCDLALLMSETEEGLFGEWQYDEALWQPADLDRMTIHFESILQFVLQHPEQALQEMDILTPEEHRIIHEMNRTASDYPEQSVIYLFEQQAMQTPNATAIEEDGVTVSYQELNRSASLLARKLENESVGAGQTVGICIGRSTAFVVSVLAVLKCGAVYVPLDPQLPEERMDYILRDSGVALVISDQASTEKLDHSPVRIMVYKELGDDGQPDRWSNADNTSDQLAYLIYTSGSTGQPKGVAVRHKGIVRLVQNTNYIDIQPEDRMAQTMNVSFDISTFEIWGALLNGAALVIMPQTVLISPSRLKQWLTDQQISVMAISAALFHSTARTQPDAFVTLQSLLIGGEALSSRWVGEVAAAGAPKRMLNSYGPSENTAITLNHEIDIHELDTDQSIPIGTPVSNTYVYVLNKYGQQLPVGVTGELYIGGEGLAAGYWNRPELTAERFVHLPQLSDGPLYRTGDLVQRRADGQIDFIGRTDDQIKLRGHRIELGEIEEALRSCPGICEAVAALTTVSGQEEPVLAVYYATEQELEAGQLRDQLQQRLPAYMVPAAWREVASFALTVNGKIDRRQLPPIQEQDLRQQAYQQPDRPGEAEIAAIWADLLNRQQIGAQDHFFAIGGHSLLAAQVVSRMEEQLQRQVTLRALFDYPVLRELAAYVQQQPVSGPASVIPAYVSEDGRYPLSPAQQRLWLVQQLEPDSQAYHIPFAFHLYGILDADRLEQAI
ncbi:non-ribosomal peptide synthetase, partial [Paenibacillus wulumuqiensis]|uniref:non-ribosomal peptide synthetase n=1 Tax=Paenibacillus wulumuqiensis TaxID=1567107 RepID=UPI00190FF4E9